ncbi:adenosylcobinamide amidohydrolase [Paenibacillus doosanensis]|uniref:Adenosylcobinamide amidohydrolase n=1 Tax=Paenibacillus konkukensis TaxID=2020716 RepID=A0ABY4RMH5_9BACL|nr:MULTISPECIES: adenosylcobinamide amidohydrolase [Paenibacillus]MCS7460099.1 adenosylcobinamide amidohydrolase [Paenibacillus doosanensis]UQZ82753.1 Adenosylcobinamide amidohydrolase [Paenibacillus konkukensis]
MGLSENRRLRSDPSIEHIVFKETEAGYASYYMIESSKPLRTLNSSMWGEGLGWHYRLVNRQVDKNYSSDDPMAEMRRFMHMKGIPADGTAALLTAARVRDRGFSERSDGEGLRVCVWATAGLGNKARAGSERKRDELFPGTINVIALIDGTLTDAAMVNCVITATEAKTAALQDCQIRIDESGETATGTTTDAVIIAATQRGRSYRYAGTATVLGYLIGRTVYEAVSYSVGRYLER